MRRKIKNISASVHQRLLNEARESSRPFNEIFQKFAMERIIYRLSKSPYNDLFILKGALMFCVWFGPDNRPTMDIDLLGSLNNNLEKISSVMKEICQTQVEEDGIFFNPDSVTTTKITEDAEYEGVRVRIKGNLGNARINIQIDIGFGDEIIPAPQKVYYPSLLDFSKPLIHGYSRESIIAAKFQVIVKFGIVNTRIKDFYDIWYLSQNLDFRGHYLTRAIIKTFQKRNTAIENSASIFRKTFKKDPEKDSQWKSFLKKAKIERTPHLFVQILEEIQTFLEPVIFSITGNRHFHKTWKAPGPWR